MSFRWTYARTEDEQRVSSLKKQLGIPETIARLLALRGIADFEAARRFFRPSLKQLHDPFLMKDMDQGAERLADAIRNQEHVLVYGDYDVDGTTATSILYTFLKEFGVKVDFYIPHRFKEGYGIGTDGVDRAVQKGCSLIVTVDCGITAIDAAQAARENGVDMIICDHHNPGDRLPAATAVLDPKRPDCGYPYKGLSGAGVGFKLVQATITRLGLAEKAEELSYRFLDLVAISIASDIVPIRDENRILMHEGLKRINQNPRPGLKALMNVVQLTPGSVTARQIVFSLGPRINAAGRMGDARLAVDLLNSEHEDQALAHAQELESINARRRKEDSQTMEKAVEQLDGDQNLHNSSSLILHDPDWHIGVIGIVASRLVDQYCRPTVMLSTVDGMIKGSARSIKGFNIYEALRQCEDLLVQYGGHEYAAGLTISHDQLNEFRQRFNRIVQEKLAEEDFQPELLIDSDLDLDEVDARFWKLLKQFEPFGPENLNPVFVSRQLHVVGEPTIVGNGHLKLRLAQNGTPAFNAIGFNMHEYFPTARRGKQAKLRAAYVLEENTWQNSTSLQMRLKDLKIDKD